MGDLTVWDLLIAPAVTFALVFILCCLIDRHVTHGLRRHR